MGLVPVEQPRLGAISGGVGDRWDTLVLFAPFAGVDPEGDRGQPGQNQHGNGCQQHGRGGLPE